MFVARDRSGGNVQPNQSAASNPALAPAFNDFLVPPRPDVTAFENASAIKLPDGTILAYDGDIERRDEGWPGHENSLLEDTYGFFSVSTGDVKAKLEKYSAFYPESITLYLNNESVQASYKNVQPGIEYLTYAVKLNRHHPVQFNDNYSHSVIHAKINNYNIPGDYKNWAPVATYTKPADRTPSISLDMSWLHNSGLDGGMNSLFHDATTQGGMDVPPDFGGNNSFSENSNPDNTSPSNSIAWSMEGVSPHNPRLDYLSPPFSWGNNTLLSRSKKRTAEGDTSSDGYLSSAYESGSGSGSESVKRVRTGSLGGEDTPPDRSVDPFEDIGDDVFSQQQNNDLSMGDWDDDNLDMTTGLKDLLGLEVSPDSTIAGPSQLPAPSAGQPNDNIALNIVHDVRVRMSLEDAEKYREKAIAKWEQEQSIFVKTQKDFKSKMIKDLRSGQKIVYNEDDTIVFYVTPVNNREAILKKINISGVAESLMVKSRSAAVRGSLNNHSYAVKAALLKKGSVITSGESGNFPDGLKMKLTVGKIISLQSDTWEPIVKYSINRRGEITSERIIPTTSIQNSHPDGQNGSVVAKIIPQNGLNAPINNNGMGTKNMPRDFTVKDGSSPSQLPVSRRLQKDSSVSGPIRNVSASMPVEEAQKYRAQAIAQWTAELTSSDEIERSTPDFNGQSYSKHEEKPFIVFQAKDKESMNRDKSTDSNVTVFKSRKAVLEHYPLTEPRHIVPLVITTGDVIAKSANKPDVLRIEQLGPHNIISLAGSEKREQIATVSRKKNGFINEIIYEDSAPESNNAGPSAGANQEDTNV
jgi:hypothetical protein